MELNNQRTRLESLSVQAFFLSVLIIFFSSIFGAALPIVFLSVYFAILPIGVFVILSVITAILQFKKKNDPASWTGLCGLVFYFTGVLSVWAYAFIYYSSGYSSNLLNHLLNKLTVFYNDITGPIMLITLFTFLILEIFIRFRKEITNKFNLIRWSVSALAIFSSGILFWTVVNFLVDATGDI